MTSESRTVFPCNTCSLFFTSSALQRTHMRQPWHVCNLQRRVSEQPAMSEQEFEALEGKSEEVTQRPQNNDDTLVRKSRVISHDVVKSDIRSQLPIEAIADNHANTESSSRCLFCPLSSPTPTTNLTHMSTQHSLFIPSPSTLYSLESFLSYLSVLVLEYHECLYCGQNKGTVDAVQTHMRDKGHCMIDTSDLLDFWDQHANKEDDEGWGGAMVTRVLGMEMRLPSGLVVNSRHGGGGASSDEKPSKVVKPAPTHSRNRNSRHRNLRSTILTAESTSQEPPTSHSQPWQLAFYNHGNDRHLSPTIPHTAQGLTGLSTQQFCTLQIQDKKMKSREETAKAKVGYAAQQQPMKTVYYKRQNPVYQAG